jgi:hypothetical protein
MTLYENDTPGWTDDTCILYPQGSGGKWLSNLIYHLVHNNNHIPVVDKIFDNCSRGPIYVEHGFEQPNNKILIDLDSARCKKRLMFSTKYSFNLYLNVVYKKILNIKDFNFNTAKKINIEQFFDLTDHAVYIMSDTTFKNFYCSQIDLEYSLIFKNSELFAIKLFELLDNVNLKYTKNTDYVIKRIEQYKNTCENPRNYINSDSSIVWLAWCHGISIVNNLTITENLSDCKTIEEIPICFKALQPKILELSRNLIFDW